MCSIGYCRQTPFKCSTKAHVQLQNRLLSTDTSRCSTKLLYTDIFLYRYSTGSCRQTGASQASVGQTATWAAHADGCSLTDTSRQHSLLWNRHVQWYYTICSRTDTSKGSTVFLEQIRPRAGQTAVKQTRSLFRIDFLSAMLSV
jgi:hypothetical protein